MKLLGIARILPKGMARTSPKNPLDDLWDIHSEEREKTLSFPSLSAVTGTNPHVVFLSLLSAACTHTHYPENFQLSASSKYR